MTTDTELPVARPIQIQVSKTNSAGLSQAYAIRELAFTLIVEAAKCPVEAEIERSRTVATLTKAWCDANDQIRILRGKPLPGVLKPTNAKRGRILKGNAELGPIPDAIVEPASTLPVVCEPVRVEPESGKA
jgi:hypothetical protein